MLSFTHILGLCPPLPTSKCVDDSLDRVTPYLADGLINDPAWASLPSDQPRSHTLEQLMSYPAFDDDESLLQLLMSLISSLGNLAYVIGSTPYVSDDPHIVNHVPL